MKEVCKMDTDELEDTIFGLLDLIDNHGFDITLDEEAETMYLRACRLVGRTPVLIEDIGDDGNQYED